MLNLVPYPRGKVQENEGVCQIRDGLKIEYGSFERWAASAFLTRLHLPENESGVVLRLNRDKTLPTEGYSLTVEPQRISVAASTERGVIEALAAAAQLCSPEYELPCARIADAPKYPHRGVSLDCSRHFFPAAEVKKVIDEMSLYKLNVLHWHLSDDQGFRIESHKFPKLNEVSGLYYTQNEIREVCAFAKLRGVEIIPEIELPGHVSAILAAYPQYSCSGRKVKVAQHAGIYDIILCAGKEEVFHFLDELLGEIIPLFDGQRFHIGGDEAPKTEWKECPDCRRRMKELGLSDYEELQVYFTERVTEIVKKHGKTPVCWNEALRSGKEPDGVQIQFWTLNLREAMAKWADQRKPWIYSDMFDLYIDYPYSMTPLKKIYRTRPMLGKKEYGSGSGLLGMETCLWTEHIEKPEDLEMRLFPRLCALAENAWTGTGSGRAEYASFLKRLTAVIGHNRQLLSDRVCYKDPSWWDPSGKARRNEALAYCTKSLARRLANILISATTL